MESGRYCLLGPDEHTEVICLENKWKLLMETFAYHIEGEAKCCHLKNFSVKGLCGRCLSEFKDWRHFSIFDPTLSTVAPLTYFLVQLPPFPVSKYSIYRHCVVGGVLSPVGDHILQEFKTLYLTRFRTYKIAKPP
jgi:hypothetical protein